MFIEHDPGYQQSYRKNNAENTFRFGIPVKVVKFIEAIISEHTGKWDTDKKQDFFNRKPKKVDTCYVTRIEIPNT